MADQQTSKEKTNPHAQWLRELAGHMRADHNWSHANTCEGAAREIDALAAHRDALLAAHEARSTHEPRAGRTGQTIQAQHDETGRWWRGPRGALPKGYTECSTPIPAKLHETWCGWRTTTKCNCGASPPSVARKMYAFELFDTEEEAALRGTPIAVYSTAPSVVARPDGVPAVEPIWLPKITPELYAQFEGTGLIEEFPRWNWTQAAVDLACIFKAQVIAPEPEFVWSRDNDATLDCLQLVGEAESVTLEHVKSWTDDECKQAEQWAGAIHLRASDNDDVEVPPMPECVRTALMKCAEGS